MKGHKVHATRRATQFKVETFLKKTQKEKERTRQNHHTIYVARTPEFEVLPVYLTECRPSTDPGIGLQHRPHPHSKKSAKFTQS